MGFAEEHQTRAALHVLMFVSRLVELLNLEGDGCGICRSLGFIVLRAAPAISLARVSAFCRNCHCVKANKPLRGADPVVPLAGFTVSGFQRPLEFARFWHDPTCDVSVCHGADMGTPLMC